MSAGATTRDYRSAIQKSGPPTLRCHSRKGKAYAVDVDVPGTMAGVSRNDLTLMAAVNAESPAISAEMISRDTIFGRPCADSARARSSCAAPLWRPVARYRPKSRHSTNNTSDVRADRFCRALAMAPGLHPKPTF